MIKRHFQHRVLVIGLVIVSTVSSALSTQKPRSARTLSLQKHDEVFDLLFPRAVLDTVGSYSLVLRYEPAFDAESQITIVARDDKMEVLEYVSTKGSIRARLDKVLERLPSASARVLASKVMVTRREVYVTNDEATRWRNDFYASACPSFQDDKLFYSGKETTIRTDETRYQMWYQGVGGRFHYDLFGPDPGVVKKSDEERIVTWMKTIYRRVRELRS